MESVGILGLFLGLVIFEIAAWLWGADSRDRPNSREWDRRRRWRAFGGPDEDARDVR